MVKEIDGILTGKRSVDCTTNVMADIKGMARFMDGAGMAILRHRQERILRDLGALAHQLLKPGCSFNLEKALSDVDGWEDASMMFAIFMAYGELLRLSEEPNELQFRFDRAYKSLKDAGIPLD